MSKRAKRIWGVLLTIFVIGAAACIWYVNDYYRCENEALDLLEESSTVQISQIEEGYFLDGSGEENAMMFYPGAKVQAESYLPLLHNLALKGVDCFLVEMPGNLAFLGKDKADDIIKEYEYTNWYMSGHSLGGAMAASYCAEHLEEVNGIVFFAAYTTESLEAERFSVLSIYGSEDKVLNMEKVEEGRELVPEDYTEVCIEGGNHAYFGNYGEQEGDGRATITQDEQQKEAIEAILKMMNMN